MNISDNKFLFISTTVFKGVYKASSLKWTERNWTAVCQFIQFTSNWLTNRHVPVTLPASSAEVTVATETIPKCWGHVEGRRPDGWERERVSLSLLGKGQCPIPGKFWIFRSRNGVFQCILSR